ncbi:hypothetical protein [Shewanella algae]|uniref:hypothetical protein n=1 Tax=Shewanella algae TaxID=38313 RepID=UPI001AAD9174|nr:hypothetical protein [Shewanella algae]MBO2601480.1 hypothetical protein [Shewanella algae]
MSEEKVEYSVSGRGGFRPGAGRKAERGKTVVMRVPEAYKAAIDGLIKHLDESKDIDKYHNEMSSEPLFFRSLKGKPQQLIFITSPKK